MKKLILKQHQIAENKYRYRVMQIVNATVPKVSATLTEETVASYCNNAQWTVTIKGE